MQRRVLRGRPGVAADQVQRLHRHVDAVAVLVLEHQELPGRATDLHGHEAEEAPDAVLLVHDGRPGIEIAQVAQDRLGIGRALAPALLAGTRPEQLCLGDDRDGRIGESESGKIRRHRDRKWGIAGDEGAPAVHQIHLVVVRPQHLLQDLAAAGGVGRQQHAAVEIPQERIQRREGMLGARIHAQLARRTGREVAHPG